MNSKQGSRYIKRRMGNDLKQKILVQNGIISEQQIEKKLSVLNCPRCSLVNAIDNKYCSKCSYPLVPSAFDEIKEDENRKLQEIQQKYEQDMKSIRQEMTNEVKKQIAQLVTNLKPNIIKEGLS
jgi:integrase/recombinase XerD